MLVHVLLIFGVIYEELVLINTVRYKDSDRRIEDRKVALSASSCSLWSLSLNIPDVRFFSRHRVDLFTLAYLCIHLLTRRKLLDGIKYAPKSRVSSPESISQVITASSNHRP